jgi:hypothetical protein
MRLPEGQLTLEEALAAQRRATVVAPLVARREEGSWRSGGARARAPDPAAVLGRWAREAGNLVLSCGLPAGKEILSSAMPEALAARLCGGRRASTVKRRVREAHKLVRWLLAAYNRTWLTRPAELMDYLMERALEPCAPSVPPQVLAAVEFVEAIGGVPEAERLSRRPTVVAVARDIGVECQGRKIGRMVKKAPPLLISIMVALEWVVMDTGKEPYMRVYAWTRLLRVWMCLRWSDTLNMPPYLASLSDGVLGVVITQSKTTGPGKKVATLTAQVTNKAWLV